MSGELQTIPARHGVATFVPRGRTIKIINTYGRQVVSTWAFSLAAPPEDGEEEEDDVEEIEEKTKDLEEQIISEKKKGKEKDTGAEENAEKVKKDIEEPKEDAGKAGKEPGSSESSKESSQEADDPSEHAPDTPENEKTTESTEKKQPQKRTWASYLPSIPYRSKGAAKTENNQDTKTDPEAEKAKNAESSKKWSSYFPTGQSFSSYVPDSKSVISAFQSSHYRDPNKSYAEQLYDFSKTPVGAGGIAAATGSGTASSLYAAYNAYAQMNPSKSSQPPMEYLSLPHTRASTKRLVPEVDDTLLTNLRAPIMTLVEDTTPGAHDTLTTACDANLYTALGVEKPEEHGSCAENLVLALKQLNEKAGLKGPRAVGADITVNIAPTPLHLFMNAPIETDVSAQSEGAGARGAKLTVDEPKGKKRSYVRFRADRDIVIVMSACPMDIGPQNGGRCMAANFMVEEASEEELDIAKSVGSIKKRKAAPRKLSPKNGQETPKKKEAGKTAGSSSEEKKELGKKEEQEEKPKLMPRPRGGPAKIAAVQKSAADAAAARRASNVETNGPAKRVDEKLEKDEESKPGKDKEDDKPATPKKKPKKIERRGGAATPSAKD